MPKSQFAIQLDALQGEVSGFLKQAGFKKKGRSYNRSTAGGLVHVINFQMGEYPIGLNYVVPGLRENLYGKFTVNLGVFLPFVGEIEWEKPTPAFIQESHCTIRDRLSRLAFGKDVWFDLGPDVAALSGTVIQLFEQFGMPFFEAFPDYSAVLAFFDAHGALPFQNENRAALEAALVAFHLGDRVKSRTLLRKALSCNHEGFRMYARHLAIRIGVEIE